MKYRTLLDNPFIELMNPCVTETITKRKLYSQCPECGIVCKTKDAFMKHIVKHYVKHFGNVSVIVNPNK